MCPVLTDFSRRPIVVCCFYHYNYYYNWSVIFFLLSADNFGNLVICRVSGDRLQIVERLSTDSRQISQASRAPKVG